jgi:hypothetical protein
MGWLCQSRGSCWLKGVLCLLRVFGRFLEVLWRIMRVWRKQSNGSLEKRLVLLLRLVSLWIVELRSTDETRIITTFHVVIQGGQLKKSEEHSEIGFFNNPPGNMIFDYFSLVPK